MKESAIQKQITDYLAAKGILHFRMNTGAMSGEHKGKKWFMRFGSPGMADVLAFPYLVKARCAATSYVCPALWIECKAPRGKQSELQKSFQAQVEAHGHKYIVARSIDDLEGLL